MKNAIQIRLAQASDESVVRVCAKEAYAKYVEVIGSEPAPMNADFQSLIASDFVYVAVDSLGTILGYVIFFLDGNDVFLENVAVRKASIGCGVGKRLITFCEAEAQRLSARSVKLYTNEKMVENLSIYPHLGYTETGRRTEDGFNRVFFEKRLR